MNDYLNRARPSSLCLYCVYDIVVITDLSLFMDKNIHIY